jgi:hypothetical protein
VRGRRPRGVAFAALAVVVLHAAPAAADPPRPTDYRSTVTSVTPGSDGVQAEIVGGDAFLQLTVAGHEVVVQGYGGEPYLRFRRDGTVERNRRSTATYLNESRNAKVDLPPQADNDAAPVWEKVADGGRYAWHDHRVHWMGQSRPPDARPGDVVQAWTVRTTVDGAPGSIKGDLVLEAGVSPLPWIVLGLLGAGAVVWLGRRRPAAVAPRAVLLGAIGALVVGAGQYRVAPAGSGVNPLLIVVPAFAVGAGAVGALGRSRSIAPAMTLAAAAAVIGWCFLRLDVLWKPVLPTTLPYNLDRAVTAVAFALALAGAGLIVWGGGLSLPKMTRAVATSGGGEPR